MPRFNGYIRGKKRLTLPGTLLTGKGKVQVLSQADVTQISLTQTQSLGEFGHRGLDVSKKESYLLGVKRKVIA